MAATPSNSFIDRLPPYVDPETGCKLYPSVNDSGAERTAYETCRQTYFSKQQQKTQTQQVQPSPNNSASQENAALKLQLAEMQKQIDALASQQASATPSTTPAVNTEIPLWANPIVPYSLLVVLIVGMLIYWLRKI